MKNSYVLRLAIVCALMAIFVGCGKQKMRARVAAVDDEILIEWFDDYEPESKAGTLIREELARRGIDPHPSTGTPAEASQKTISPSRPHTTRSNKASSTDATESKTHLDALALNHLMLRYGDMTKPADYDVSHSSFAFRTSGRTVILILRNFKSPNRVYATPPIGRATLFIALNEGNLVGNADHDIWEVAPGTYQPGRFRSGSGSSPGGLLVLVASEGDDLYIFTCGTWWMFSGDGEIQEDLWFSKRGLSAAQQREKLDSVGTVTITEISKGDTGELAGQINMGGDGYLGLAKGSFRVPLIKKPDDFPPSSR